MTKTSSVSNGHFGYDLIRNHVLSDILGAHEDDILYWAGKSLARKFPLSSLAEAPDFFHQADFGKLSLEKNSRHEAVYSLSPLSSGGRCFKLEAGFLAEQKQNIDGFVTEAYEEPHPKKKMVRITLKWDLKDKVEE
ncbi:MAG TPA: YslB family protein [Planococcus sp. (in: firmicutes)]|nr:YslB family protein [Planococcus sp. (in: firmicutes)]